MWRNWPGPTLSSQCSLISLRHLARRKELSAELTAHSAHFVDCMCSDAHCAGIKARKADLDPIPSSSTSAGRTSSKAYADMLTCNLTASQTATLPLLCSSA